MITLPEPLNKVMRSGNLEGIKPFAVLIRNKWHEESGGDSYFALDTDNPIDITAMIVKPNTLSMTLDVNEVAQYKANNVTLTIYDPFNRFIEGTPISFFPQGYQLYGSQVILYYGLDDTNRTPLFVGVIKDLPTHKPESYQVDLKLISPLELLNDIEAKDFSDKYEGETLTLHGQDDDNNPIYQTAHTGVGGFSAIYADGVKMFEGVDYQVSQLSELNLPAFVTIINTDLHSATITADYYCWKTGLSVEQIVSGLVALAGYIDNTSIQPIIWQTEVRNPPVISPIFAALGYYEGAPNEYTFNWGDTSKKPDWQYNDLWENVFVSNGATKKIKNIIPNNFDYSFTALSAYTTRDYFAFYAFGSEDVTGTYGINNGIVVEIEHRNGYNDVSVLKVENKNATELLFQEYGSFRGCQVNLEKRGNNATVKITDYFGGTTITKNISYQNAGSFNICNLYTTRSEYSGNPWHVLYLLNQTWNFYDSNSNLIAEDIRRPCIITTVLDKTNDTFPWGAINAEITQNQQTNATPEVNVYLSNDGNNWSEPLSYNLGVEIARSERYLRYMIYISNIPQDSFNITNPNSYYYDTDLVLNLINLSNKSILEALQDFALISGYEFGVDRQGVFFFRPRSQSTTPVYDLDHNEIVKIDNVQKRFNDFFTKLTLQFGQRPLEFYANEGERPTPVDKYGIINKEIDKPDIVNYDNPELAQAIGPQLLAIYSNLADIIQLTGKLNLNLELGDVVNLKRNYNLTVPNNASDITKFNSQDTYFRACKITGLNYNFAKRQITYTLRDVSNETNKPQYQFDEFIYDFQVPLGVKE